MLPDAVKFSSRMRRLGLGDGTRIVLYDNNKFSASARAWWMLRLFGHPDVVVLDGGLAEVAPKAGRSPTSRSRRGRRISRRARTISWCASWSRCARTC